MPPTRTRCSFCPATRFRRLPRLRLSLAAEVSEPADRFRSRNRISRFASDQSPWRSRSAVCHPAKTAGAPHRSAWVKTARFTTRRRHNPEMRNPRVLFKIDIFAVEYDPFIRPAKAPERRRASVRGLRESGDGEERDSGDQNPHGPQTLVELSRPQLLG